MFFHEGIGKGCEQHTLAALYPVPRVIGYYNYQSIRSAPAWDQGIASMNNRNGRPIFLVDDEPKILQAVAATLERIGLAVSCFENAADCLESLDSQRCDLLIADLRMPGMDGIELTRQVKRRSPWIPVMILTGYGNIPTAVEAIKTGAVDFIEKPIDKKSFVRKVESLLAANGNHGRLGQPLTESEERILKLILGGKTNKEIATLLNRSIRTIESHRAHVMHKLGAGSLVDLLKRVAAMGLAVLGAGGDGGTNPASANEDGVS